jgi:molecular chaperone GrpE (heat shock protein)
MDDEQAFIDPSGQDDVGSQLNGEENVLAGAESIESSLTLDSQERAPEEAFGTQSDTPDIGAAVSQRLAQAEIRLDEALALAKHRDQLVDRLHRENQQLRQGELQSAILPLLRDLMRLLDDLEQMLEHDPEAGDVQFVHGAVQDILSRHGICGFAPEQHDPFDSTVHSAIGTVPTDSPEEDRRICAVRRRGFRRDDGSVLRAADVTVYRHRPDSAAAPAAEPSSGEGAADEPTQNIDEERT